MPGPAVEGKRLLMGRPRAGYARPLHGGVVSTEDIFYYTHTSLRGERVVGVVQAAVPAFWRCIAETCGQIFSFAQTDGRAAGNAVQGVGRNGYIGVQLTRNITCQPAQQRAAAGQQHAGTGYIGCQFGRGAFQHIAGGRGNAGGQLLHRLVQIGGYR